jgi:acyl-coenzyme A synthetase/AMP-(fatty) acid ligase
MSTSFPVLGSKDLQSTMLWSEGRPITRSEFLRRVVAVAEQLPQARYSINLCQDRYNFCTAFAAACLRGQTNLLPASSASGALNTVRDTYTSHHILDDERLNTISASSTAPSAIPSIDADHCAAIAFTSGSTGQPQAHASSWSTLIASARRSAARIFSNPKLNLVATVPSQHMFGLEMTILQPLVNDCAVDAGKPFFPADIVSALKNLPAPRALITTPAHLKACVSATPSGMPDIDFVLSATAPLARELAQAVESAWSTRVLEIYGSTETGAIASRRTVEGDTWELLPGGRLEAQTDDIQYRPDGAESIKLHDRFDLQDDRRFTLAGRSNDLIKVAGKRASLADLNAKLLAIDGVLDGVIFQPEPDGRVAALVVAGISEREVLAALTRDLDEVFVPRPLRLVRALPRDEVGKLARAKLLAALKQA